MKLIDLFEQQNVIRGNVLIPSATTTLVGYKHNGIPIAGARIEGNFSCYSTKITSLEGAPSHVEVYFYCYNTNLTSLEGAPSYVGGGFDCSNTKITSLHNVHKQIKHVEEFVLSNTIKSNIIGVMLLKGLKRIYFYEGSEKQNEVENIINKHLAGDRNVHACQEELIEAGFPEYAKL